MSIAHRTKREVFDLTQGINIDPKGFERVVDTYQETPWGLYMARGADHPKFGYIEAWVLPEPNIRVTKWHFREGYDTGQSYYVDIAHNEQVAPGRWETTDLYVDLVCWDHQRPQVLDLDELAESLAAGFIDHDTMAQALATTAEVLRGIEQFGSLERWLASRGVPLTWLSSVTLAPPSE